MITLKNSLKFTQDELGGLEAVMPVAAKDMSKVPFSVDLLLKNTPVTKVHVITDSHDFGSDTEHVAYHHESSVLPYGSDFFDFRPKWIFQQMLKLMQDVTAGEWYVSIDADTFVMRPIALWDANGPYLFYEIEREKIVGAYDTFNKKFLGFSNYPFSVLNNIVLFNKSIIGDIMRSIGAADSLEFAEKVRAAIGVGSYPAEAQLLLSWLLSANPNFYRLRELRAGWRGVYDSYVFDSLQIEETIRRCPRNLDILLLHSWETKPEGYIGGTYQAVW